MPPGVSFLVRDLLTAPRVQVPIAATVLVVLVTTVALVASIRDVSPESIPLVLLVVAPAALVANQSLFVRARTPRAAYVRAVVWPPVGAVIMGPAVVAWMYATHPDAEYSFGGTPIFDVGRAWPLFVAVGSVMLGCVVSAFLALEVWLVARSTDRSRTPVWAWCAVVVAAAIVSPFSPLTALAIGALAALAASLLALDVSRRTRPPTQTERGPYRSTTAR